MTIRFKNQLIMDKDHTHNSGDVHIQNNLGRRTQESASLLPIDVYIPKFRFDI
jgi:hypothetical protein